MKSLSPVSAGSLGLAVKGRYLHLAILLTAFLVLLGSQALGQDATIIGTVTDASGAVVPNATITVTSIDKGTTRSLTTNSDGQYAAPSLPIGHYTVRAQATGFKAAEQKGVELNVAEHARVDFKLEVGNVQESVSVEANAVAVQTDTGEVSTVINGEQVSQLLRQQLLLDAEGELSAHEEKLVRAHLSACWTCRARRQEFEKAIADFVRSHKREFEPELPPAAGPRALLKARLAELPT